MTRQLLYAPAPMRHDQVFRAERLHDELEPAVNYPQDYVLYRITGYEAVESSDTLLIGEALLPDLRLVIDLLSRSVDIVETHTPDDPSESARQMAGRLNISTKTVARWRKAGLRWRWMLVNGKKELRIPQRAFERFCEVQGDRVKRATSFSQIDEITREQLIKRARRIATTCDGVSLNQVATQLAQEVDRAVETVRLILQQHDNNDPDDAIFSHQSGPLDADQKESITRAYESGVSVGQIAKLFRRTRSTIYRAIHERRSSALRKRPILFAWSATYDRDDADEVILRPEKNSQRRSTISTVPVNDLPEALQDLYRQPIPAHDEQRSLSVRMNYLKYKAARIRDRLDPYEPRVADMDRIDEILDQADHVRNRLVIANLPVVLTVARTHLLDLPDRSRTSAHLMNLLETGNRLLIESVDDYDPYGKQHLERHISWVLRKTFASEMPVGEASRAHRREKPEIVLERMVDSAKELGVDLSIN